MTKTKILNILNILLSTICLACISFFCIKTGIEYKGKKKVDFDITNDDPMIFLSEKINFEKKNFEKFEECESFVTVEESAFEKIQGMVETSAIVGKEYKKGDAIGVNSSGEVILNNDCIVLDVNASSGEVEIYNFGKFVVSLQLTAEQYYHLNYKTDYFVANINGFEYDLSFESLDLTYVGSFSTFIVNYSAPECKTIVTESSFYGAKHFVCRYENVYCCESRYFNDSICDSSFYYQNSNFEWEQIILSCVDIIDGYSIILPEYDLEALGDIYNAK